MIAHTLPSLRVVSHSFSPADLCAGHVALDFVNTAAGLNRDPRDWLDSYVRLVEWADLADVGDAELRRELIAVDQAQPLAGQRALERARLLRSALHHLLHASREDLRPADAAVMELQHWCRRAGAALAFRWSGDGALRVSLKDCGLDVISATIAQSAAELLAQPIGGQLGLCAGHNCGWIFLDRSKSRRRRWCDMRTCGNAAKASRHYRKRHSTGAG